MMDKAGEPFDVAAFARRFDHHAPEFPEHIDAIFHHMRQACPVARSPAHGGFRVLTRYADIVRVVRDDEGFSLRPALMAGAVEEMLRLFSPQPGLARVATRDALLGEDEVKEGERVFMFWAAGNRDPAVFADPDRFDIRRRPNRHIAFGAGAHHCLGANLTRLEARVCMAEVLRRLPGYRLVEPGLRRIPEASVVHGFMAVPVVFPRGTRER